MEYDRPPTTIAEVMERVRASRAALERLVDGLDDDCVSAPAPNGGWSVKDHLAHIAAWERILVATIEGAPVNEIAGLDRASWESLTDTDELNAVLERRAKNLPVAEVRADFRASHRRAVATLSRLTDADLRRPVSSFQPDSPDDARPIRDKIAGDTYGHYLEHLPWIEAVIT